MNFLSYLINGISLGSVYAIIALGYTMVYGIAKMLNFAHGDVIMVGCYIVFMTMSGQGWGAIPAVVLSIIVCTLLGIVIEKIAYKPLRKATPLAVLITAIGVSYFLENAALLIFGADTRSFTNVVTLPAGVVNIGKDGSFCYVLKDGVITRQDITTGISSEDSVEITDGIKAGDEVIEDLGSPEEGMTAEAAPADVDSAAETGETANE